MQTTKFSISLFFLLFVHFFGGEEEGEGDGGRRNGEEKRKKEVRLNLGVVYLLKFVFVEAHIVQGVRRRASMA